MSIDEFFATSHARERPIFDVMTAHLDTLGPYVTDPVQVGVFFKNGPMFAEFRPKTKWVAVTFMLAHALDHSRLSRKVVWSGKGPGARAYHVVNVDDPAQIDDELCGWLTEAYDTVDDG